MNAAAIIVLKQIFNSPVTSLTASALVSTWVKSFHWRTDPTLYTYSYTDLVIRQQWWKLFTAPFFQTSFLSLLFNTITLWGIRSIEVTYGSWFFFRYSLLLIVVEGLLTTSAIHLIITYSSSQYPFRNISTGGLSGVLISWLAYQQISGVVMNDPFYLFGILPLTWDLAPLFVTLITPSFLNSKTVIILNVVSLLCGYFLSFGLLAILPDVYWSACFLFNVAIFLLIKSSHFQAFIESLNNDNRGAAIATHDVVEEEQRVNGLDDGDIEMGRGEIGSERNRERERRSGDISGSSSPNSRIRNQWDSEGAGSSARTPLLGQRGGRGESKGREEEEDEEEEEGLFESRRYPDDASSSIVWGGRR
jgi:membrane associated rhomboid family serine protease